MFFFTRFALILPYIFVSSTCFVHNLNKIRWSRKWKIKWVQLEKEDWRNLKFFLGNFTYIWINMAEFHGKITLRKPVIMLLKAVSYTTVNDRFYPLIGDGKISSANLRFEQPCWSLKVKRYFYNSCWLYYYMTSNPCL